MITRLQRIQRRIMGYTVEPTLRVLCQVTALSRAALKIGSQSCFVPHKWRLCADWCLVFVALATFFRGFLRVIIGVAILVSSSVYGNDQQTALQQQQAALVKEMAKLQTWINNAHQETSALTQQLANNERNISQTSNKIRETKQKLSDLTNQSSNLLQQKHQLEESLAVIEQHLNILLRQQYQLQQRQQSGFIFGLTNTNDIGRMIANFRYLTDAQVLEITNYRANLDKLQLITQQQNETEATLAAELRQLKQAEQTLVNIQKQRSQTLEKLRQQSRSKTQELADNQATQAQVNALLRQIEALIAQQKAMAADLSFAQRQGQLAWPVNGKILNNFGQQQSRFPLSSDGWLIQSPLGTDVAAVHGGHVVFSDWFKGFGLMLIINHNDGYLTLYGKNQSLYKRVGDKVSRGEIIAKSGNSGNQNTNALYFSIRKNGQPQHPSRWLKNN